jgi:uncharacterized protein
VSESLVGRVAVKSKTLKPGEAVAIPLSAGQLLQISSLEGKQVADLVAVNPEDTSEVLSTGATRSINSTIMLQKGMKIYSNLRKPLFALLEDTVGRHDMMFAACDPTRYKEDYGIENHASCRAALTEALQPFGMTFESIPDPINVFMNVAIVQRGELELRESLAEANDFVILEALTQVVAAISACPQDQNEVNGMHPTDIMVRVFR